MNAPICGDLTVSGGKSSCSAAFCILCIATRASPLPWLSWPVPWVARRVSAGSLRRSETIWRFLAAVLGCVLLAAPTLALAQTPETASLISEAESLSAAGRFDSAIATYRRAEAVADPDDAAGAERLYDGLGMTLVFAGRPDGAEVAFRRLIDALERQGLADTPAFTSALTMLGYALSEQGRFYQADPVLRAILARTRADDQATPSEVANALNNLAANLDDLGQHEEARSLFGESIAVLVGKPNVEFMLAAMLLNMGAARQDMGDVAESFPFFEASVPTARARMRDRPAAMVEPVSRLAQATAAIGNVEAAEALHREARTLANDLAPNNQDRIRAEVAYAAFLIDQGRIDEATLLIAPLSDRLRASLYEETALTQRGSRLFASAHATHVRALWDAAPAP